MYSWKFGVGGDCRVLIQTVLLETCKGLVTFSNSNFPCARLCSLSSSRTGPKARNLQVFDKRGPRDEQKPPTQICFSCFRACAFEPLNLFKRGSVETQQRQPASMIKHVTPRILLVVLLGDGQMNMAEDWDRLDALGDCLPGQA